MNSNGSNKFYLWLFRVCSYLGIFLAQVVGAWEYCGVEITNASGSAVQFWGYLITSGGATNYRGTWSLSAGTMQFVDAPDIPVTSVPFSYMIAAVINQYDGADLKTFTAWYTTNRWVYTDGGWQGAPPPNTNNYGTVTEAGRHQARARIQNLTSTNRQYETYLGTNKMGSAVTVEPGGTFDVDFTTEAGTTNLMVKDTAGNVIWQADVNSPAWANLDGDPPMISLRAYVGDTGTANPPPIGFISTQSNTNPMTIGAGMNIASLAHDDAERQNQQLSNIASNQNQGSLWSNNFASGLAGVIAGQSNTAKAGVQLSASSPGGKMTNSLIGGVGVLGYTDPAPSTNNSFTFAAGTALQQTMTLSSTASHLEWFDYVRSILAWIIAFTIMYWIFNDVMDAVALVLQVPQATTAGQSVGGTNVAFAAAVICAAIIIATIWSIPVFVVAYIDTADGLWTTVKSGAYTATSSLLTSGAAAFTLKAIPVATAITAFTVYVTHRVILKIGMAVAGTTVKGLVGG